MPHQGVIDGGVEPNWCMLRSGSFCNDPFKKACVLADARNGMEFRIGKALTGKVLPQKKSPKSQDRFFRKFRIDTVEQKSIRAE